MNKAYSEAAVEVLDILDHTAVEKVNLIPVKFINYLKENAAKDYKPQLDYSKPINEMNIKVETKGIIGTICRNWWWSHEQRLEYKDICNANEKREQEELRKKYNLDDLFKNTKVEQIKTENTTAETVQMVEYKKENIFRRFFNKILNVFKTH